MSIRGGSLHLAQFITDGQDVAGTGAVEPFRKAGDKSPTGMEHRGLKWRKGKLHGQEMEAEKRLVDLSDVSRTVAGAGSPALEGESEPACLVFCSQGGRIMYKTQWSAGPSNGP